VRVVAGRVDGESSRWRYRQSATDPLIVDGVVALSHGARAALRVAPEPDSIRSGAALKGRGGHVVFDAVVGDVLARVQISVEPHILERFGLDPAGAPHASPLHLMGELDWSSWPRWSSGRSLRGRAISARCMTSRSCRW
jgi:hypothetical protein